MSAPEGGFHLGQTLRRAPQHGTVARGAEPGGASVRYQGVEVIAPARTRAARKPAGHLRRIGGRPRHRFLRGREAEHHERIVHLVGGGGAGPCLLPDLLDGVRIEPSDVGG